MSAAALKNSLLVIRDMNFVSIVHQDMGRPHAHSDGCEFHFFVRGEGTFTTLVNGHHAVPIEPGSLFFSLPDETHRIDRNPSSPSLTLYFTRFAFRKISAERDLVPRLRRIMPPDRFIRLGDSQRFFFEEMKRRHHSGDRFLSQAAEHQLLSLIYSLLGGPATAVELAPSSHIDKAVDHIQKSIYRKLSLEELSQRVGIDKFHLVRLFKKKTGTSPLQYFQRLKIETAKYLLEKTDQSIQHISEELQFSDAFHFSRAFKKHFGLSPGHHRNRTQ